MSLEGQFALVVGASSGAGRATALALARAGADVLAAARREPLLEELRPERIRIAALDVTDPEAVRQLAASLDRLDVLVYSAGVNVRRRAPGELSLEDWRLLLDVNATGAFVTVQACLPLLRASRGLVILIGSVSSRWNDASGIGYQAAKRALLGLAHGLGRDEPEIRVSAVLPGMISTDFVKARPVQPTPDELAKGLQPEDVAAACLFLAQLDRRAYVPELVIAPSELPRVPA